MTDIGFALEKLIDVLQLEGHELFRIFTEVQSALAIQNALMVIAFILGIVLGVVYGLKTADWAIEKYNVDEYEKGMYQCLFLIIVPCFGVLFLLLITDAITSIYMHAYYPEYYAAKELIQQIGNLVP